MASRTPSMVDVMGRILDGQSALLGVCMPAEVETFSRTDQTASVRIVTLKTDGSARPLIPNAPVIFPGVYWDVQPGEGGILILADEDWRSWWRTGEDSGPESEASHELANAFFIPGLRSLPAARTLPAATAVLENPKAGGEVRLGDQAANKAAVHEDLPDDLDTLMTDLNTWGTTAFANWAAAAAAFTANVTPTITAFKIKVAASQYISPSVMVED